MGKATERLQGVTLRDRPQSPAEVKFGLDQVANDPGKGRAEIAAGATKEAVRQTVGSASKAINDGIAGVTDYMMGGSGNAEGADWFGVADKGTEKVSEKDREGSQPVRQNDGFGM